MKKISIKKIADLAGVSKTTVSFVLNGLGDEKNISSKTQKKIIEIAKSHNYQANFIARSLSIGKSFTIGFIVPDISNPFFGKVVKFVEQFAEDKGYSVMVASTGENIQKEKKIIDSFKARQIDGIILATASKNHQQYFNEVNNGLPTVFFDRIFESTKTSCVDIDNTQSTQLLTQTLIDKGHKTIGLITLTSYLPNITQRINGYKQALSKNSIILNKELIYEVDYKNIRKDVKTAIDNLTSLKQPVTAIVFLNNVLAAEGIWSINTYYPELINTLLFASFDNLDLFDYSRPKVISVLQPAKEIAMNCIEMLHNKIESSEETKRVQLKTKIILR